jgi:hypothetical protein
MLVQTLPSLSLARLRETSRTSGQSFRLTDSPRAAGAGQGPGSTAALASLGTLLSVQQVEPTGAERRRRAVRRGEQLLAALEEVQLNLLAGETVVHALARVRALLGENELAGDEDLDRVLQEIEVRAAVELAKRECEPHP